MKADKIYFLSPKSEVPTGATRIEFNKLDKYELSQTNYITDIEPYTYSLVRGEKLVKILEAIVDLIYSHQHNLVGPPVPSDPNYIKLVGLMKTLKTDILNREIRIN